MSQISNRQTLDNFINSFAKLLAEFYDVIDLFTTNEGIINIPDAPVYEFQHAIVHLAHTFGSDDREFKIGQYKQACAHIERGILDAWKLLLFDQGVLEKKQKEQNYDFFRVLLDSRLTEFKEIKSKTMVDDTPTCRKKYAELYRRFVKSTNNNINTAQLVRSENRNIGKELFASLFNWAEFELVLSSLQGKKDLDILKDLIIILKNDGVNSDIDKATGEIALKIINKFDGLGLVNTLGNKEERQNAVTRAYEYYKKNNENASCFIDVCREHFIKPFCGEF